MESHKTFKAHGSIKETNNKDNFCHGGKDGRIWSIKEYYKVRACKSSTTNTGIHTSTTGKKRSTLKQTNIHTTFDSFPKHHYKTVGEFTVFIIPPSCAETTIHIK